MMGRRKRDQGKLFYDFRLEDRIPDNHLLRRMNVFVGVALADLHKELEPLSTPERNCIGGPEQKSITARQARRPPISGAFCFRSSILRGSFGWCSVCSRSA
jgi:hypothetical protein